MTPALLLGLLAGPARATPTWPPPCPGAVPEVAVRAGGSAGWGLVPPFSAAERRRLAGEIAVDWAPAEPVRLHLDWAWLADRFSAGTAASGPGDVRLGTEARLGRWRGVEARLGWWAKLPNASDELGLGTDETDSGVLAAVAGRLGPVEVAAAAGMEMLGHPFRFAEQDDAAVGWLAARLPAGPVALEARTGGALASAENPARLLAAVGVEGACPRLLGAEVAAGLTPAAPDVAVRAWLGWGAGCPGR